MRARPLTLAQANDLVEKLHRHHKRVQGHRFTIGAEKDGVLVGAATVGRPVARMCDTYGTAEVTRLVTDGTKNACSFLYAACARAAEAMGFDKIQTYILDTENGVTLKAAGWTLEEASTGGSWDRVSRGRTDKAPLNPKQRWAKMLGGAK